MSTILPEQGPVFQRWQRLGLVVGVVALVVCIIGAFFSPLQFFRAYLTAYLFCLGIPHGSMILLCVYYLTGGAWGFLIRRILEAGVRLMPLLTVLFIPIACGVGPLYAWADPDLVASTPDLQHKQIYLNPPFFWGRAALFFALWLAITYCLVAWSRRQDETGDPRYGRWLATLAGPGLVVYGITITFASVDWIMSLQPGFRSTIFGPLFASGELLSAHAFALIVLAWMVGRRPVAQVLSVEALNDLGSLMFTFLVIWAYMGFFQFMLIWIANLPYDVSWYVPRGQGGWQWVGAAIFALEFAAPFFLLLQRDIKREPHNLARVCGLILFMHLVYQYWQVMPAFKGTTLGQHWMDFLMPLALGGPCLAYFLWQLQRFPVLPLHDPSRESAAHLHHLDEERVAREQEMHHG